MPIEKQQQQQLDSFIECIEEALEEAKIMPEEGYDLAKGEGKHICHYIDLASMFFCDEISILNYCLIGAIDKSQFNSRVLVMDCLKSLLYLMRVCKEDLANSLSGEYPGGGPIAAYTSWEEREQAFKEAGLYE